MARANELYITTAGMAAKSPMAVASSASAMPGATTARLVVLVFDMPIKLSMIPQTVPKRPTKGAVAPIVARTPVPRRIARPACASMRDKRIAALSLMPSCASPSERSASLAAAAIKRAMGARASGHELLFSRTKALGSGEHREARAVPSALRSIVRWFWRARLSRSQAMRKQVQA